MTADAPRIELYVRSLAPTEARDTQEAVVERLQRLDETGRISGFELALCGDCVCPSLNTAATDTGERLLRRYEAFQRWAASQDRELTGFRQRDTESLLTGTTVTGVVFPRITLAEYRNGGLAFVAPSANGTDQTGVLDRLDAY
ncbi:MULTISPECIES: HTH domain-containing protein [Salinibaculum]|uniref:HTH domain-containing protein n=1 Tax=Salinibaculum TaxID=2732368 RepID=UPI0030D1ED88